MLTSEVTVGEVVEVRPGERNPLDGKVIEGSGSVDESSFTGESVPATKAAGAEVMGGRQDTSYRKRFHIIPRLG